MLELINKKDSQGRSALDIVLSSKSEEVKKLFNFFIE